MTPANFLKFIRILAHITLHFSLSIVHIAIPSRYETLLAHGFYPSLDEREEPLHDAGEETGGVNKRKREENGQQRGLFASECKPRLSVLCSCASVHARTHARTHA